MKYVLINIRMGRYFKGYRCKDKELHGNKPIWTNEISEALQFADASLAEHTRRRLFCQSQFVELVTGC